MRMPAPLKGLVWPLSILMAVLLFNLVFNPRFFALSIVDGEACGSIIDVFRHGSQVILLSAGMSLVIAVGGIDLSVGATMALASAASTMMVLSGIHPSLAIGAGIAAGAAMGLVNALLIRQLNLQPIVATLMLMVAGRGVAQLVTDGQIITFEDTPGFHFLASAVGGSVGLLPTSAVIALAGAGLIHVISVRTNYGMWVRSIGESPSSAYICGINQRAIGMSVYIVSGVCAAVAGLIASAEIRCADPGHTGLALELDAILAVVIGGASLSGGGFSIIGSLIGAIVMQMITTTLYMMNVNPEIAQLPKAVFIILICLCRSDWFAAIVSRRSKEFA